MPVPQARALFDGGAVRVEEHDPARDRVALRGLAVWAYRLSPVVSTDEPDGLLLDVTGCQEVYGSEGGLVRVARDGLAQLGFRTRMAISPSYGSAWALARHGKQAESIVGPHAVRAEMAPLPLSCLRIGEDMVASLGELGITKVGELLDLPRTTLPARFGEMLLLRLDQALGQAIETISPIRSAPPPEAFRLFDGPTDRVEAIEHAVRELIADVSRELLNRESGARGLEVTLTRSDVPPEQLTITLGRPSRDPKHLWTLLAPKLERANLGYGVEAVRVRVRSVGRLRHEQGARWEDDPDELDGRAFSELIDTLANRLGPGRVLRGRLGASHLPERANRLERFTNSHEAPEPPPPVMRDRPTLLLSDPLPADVIALTPDGPVHRVRWRDGDEAVLTSIGPERIAPEWWRAITSTRDYFTIQTQSGRWLWLVRGIESGRWHIHGVWA